MTHRADPDPPEKPEGEGAAPETPEAEAPAEPIDDAA